jgi:lipopolysaccharide export system permease protein
VSRFDRYILSQLLATFGFFSLVLVGIYWINRAVGLFEQLIGDGQSALVFLEFSLLTLPNVIRLVLPVSAFVAAVYVTNRLSQDSEMVVVQATGRSPMRLARPVLAFGLIVAAMMAVLMNLLVPASRSMLADRSAEISENVTARFLSDGQFMHPARGVTLYIREITPAGELRDLFLADDRNPARRVIHTARTALLARGDDGPKLVMLDGQSQVLDAAGQRLSVTGFADFTYDLAGILTAAGRKGRSLDEARTRDLLAADEALLAETGKSRAEALQEGHSRLAQPLLATAAALIGFATLMMGSFSRFGLWRQILVAVALLIGVQLIHTAASGLALSAGIWPAVYAAPVAGGALALGQLLAAQRARRVAPPAPAPQAGPRPGLAGAR